MQTIEAACNFVSPGYTYNTLPGATMDTMPAIAMDSQYWLAGGRISTVFTLAHQMSSMTGVTGTSSMTFFDVGDDSVSLSLNRVRVGFISDPTSAVCYGFKKQARGAVTTTGGSGVYSAGKFDVRQSARFHRTRVDLVGNWEASGVEFDVAKAGVR